MREILAHYEAQSSINGALPEGRSAEVGANRPSGRVPRLRDEAIVMSPEGPGRRSAQAEGRYASLRQLRWCLRKALLSPMTSMLTKSNRIAQSAFPSDLAR